MATAMARFDESNVLAQSWKRAARPRVAWSRLSRAAFQAFLESTMPVTDARNLLGPGSRPSSRFGPAAIVRESPASEDTHLLAQFAAAAASGGGHVPERRRWVRVPAVEHRAWLGWWVAPSQFTTEAARLEDISHGGARLLTADPPAPGLIVWLCLGTPEPTECVQAKVVAVSAGPEGQSIVRLAFGTPCPENLYRVAVHGLAALKG
jgi:hypothetical protein